MLDRYHLMCTLLLEVVKGVMSGFFTLLAVALGSLIALMVYFRQKEYELTKQRYLEGGVDIIAAELDAAFGVVSHNYARCLQICKSFRDTGDNFDIKELERGFLPFDSSKFHQIAHHRVSSLLQSELIWEVYQSAMAHATSADAMITKEVPEAIRIIAAEPLGLRDRKQTAEQMIQDLREVHDGSFKYALLVRELHALSLLLEAEKLSLKAVASFSKRPEVIALIVRLREGFLSEQNQST